MYLTKTLSVFKNRMTGFDNTRTQSYDMFDTKFCQATKTVLHKVMYIMILINFMLQLEQNIHKIQVLDMEIKKDQKIDNSTTFTRNSIVLVS